MMQPDYIEGFEDGVKHGRFEMMLVVVSVGLAAILATLIYWPAQ